MFEKWNGSKVKSEPQSYLVQKKRIYLTIFFLYSLMIKMGLLWWLSGKKSTCSAADPGFDPWVKKIPWMSEW